MHRRKFLKSISGIFVPAIFAPKLITVKWKRPKSKFEQSIDALRKYARRHDININQMVARMAEEIIITQETNSWRLVLNQLDYETTQVS